MKRGLTGGVFALPLEHELATTRGGAAAMSEASEDAFDAEQEALAAIDRGDYEGALNILMEAYGASVYRYCRQLVADPDLAEDAHQMTFVQALEGLGRFRRRSTLRTWLYGIARHRCLDALKIARRRRQRFEPADDLSAEADATAGAEDRLVAGARSRILELCIGKLASRVRTAIVLRYQAGVSYPEMARICRDRPATLQARVARALPVLRRCLESRGVSL